jgi:hypothetical protein
MLVLPLGASVSVLARRRSKRSAYFVFARYP